MKNAITPKRNADGSYEYRGLRIARAVTRYTATATRGWNRGWHYTKSEVVWRITGSKRAEMSGSHDLLKDAVWWINRELDEGGAR